MFGTRSAGTTYDDHDSPPKRQPPRAAAQPSAARGPGRDRGCDVHVDRRLHYAEQVLKAQRQFADSVLHQRAHR